MNLIPNRCSEFTLLKLLPHLPAVNELIFVSGDPFDHCVWCLIRESVLEILAYNIIKRIRARRWPGTVVWQGISKHSDGHFPMSGPACNLTHWGRLTHICVSTLTIIDSDNGLSPGRRQAIIWTNAWILLIAPLGTNFNEILIKILTFYFKIMHLKLSSEEWQPFCICLNVLS